MAHYQDELDANKKEIRCLILLPAGNDDAMIECHTEKVSLHGDVTYEALSYVWGDPNAEVDVPFNEALVNVTANLGDALYHLRRKDKPRILWVDALCINQNDTTERNQQVSITGDIYRRARPVLVYLGSSFEATDSTFELMQGLEHVDDIDEELHSKLFGLYHELSGQAWFQRLWTVQELVLGSQDPVVICGPRSMSWTQMYNILSSVARVEFERMGLLASIQQNRVAGTTLTGLRMDVFNDLRLETALNEGETLRKLLLTTRNCMVTEPRDRIYALVGMMSNEHRMDITVDYKRPLGSVYAEALSHIFKTGEGPLFLSSTVLTALSADPYMPSWIPKFGDEHLLRPMIFHPPSIGVSGWGSQAVNGEVDQDLRRLRVRGMFVDTVSRKIDFRPAPEHLQQLSEGLKLAVDAEHLLATHATQRPYLRQFKNKEPIWKVLIANRMNDPRGRFPASKSYGKAFEALVSHDFKADAAVLKEYKRCLDACLPGNSFFITATGFYGLCPAFVEEDDCLAVLFGAGVPFVMRPIAQLHSRERETLYALLGVAYVGGIMDGELVDEVYCEDLEDDVTFTLY